MFLEFWNTLYVLVCKFIYSLYNVFENLVMAKGALVVLHQNGTYDPVRAIIDKWLLYFDTFNYLTIYKYLPGEKFSELGSVWHEVPNQSKARFGKLNIRRKTLQWFMWQTRPISGSIFHGIENCLNFGLI